ncbi:MAG TPA: WG repeat-containing protein [Phycisphaerae bacterium]|nr:WG repeat-containing protein [Phycisphaerae bacterium]
MKACVVFLRRMGAAALILVSCATAFSCKAGDEAQPGVTPAQFVTVTIYNYDPDREDAGWAPGPKLLWNRGYHVTLGREATKRLFSDMTWTSEGAIRKTTLLVVAQTEDGERRLVGLCPGGLSVSIKGEPGDFLFPGELGDVARKYLYPLILKCFQPQPKRLNRLRAHEVPEEPWPMPYGEKFGFLDPSGNKMIIAPQFDDAQPFSEGLAAVRVGDADSGRWGYVNMAGSMVIPPRFTWACPFSEGRAAVTVGDLFEGKQGYINRAGEMVVDPQFDTAGVFIGGRAKVYRQEQDALTHMYYLTMDGTLHEDDPAKQHPSE